MLMLSVVAGRRIAGAAVSVLLLGVVVSCASPSEKIAEGMQASVEAHTGEWTETDLRDAAGEYADGIEKIEVAADGTGGVLYLVTEEHEKGDSYTDSSTKRSNGKTRTVRETKYHDDWAKVCVRAVVEGATVQTEHYSVSSTSGPVACAEGRAG